MAFLVTYSFLHVKASLVGPNGTISLGSDAGAADEGITIERVEDNVTTRAGADGQPIHMLHASKVGKITINLMKTSQTNALLSALYDADTTNPATFGLNTIVVSWMTAGDIITGRYCAFARPPSVTYAKEAPSMVWPFNVGILDYALGAGF